MQQLDITDLALLKITNKCYLWGDVNALELIDNAEVANELDVLLDWVLNININQKHILQVVLKFEPSAEVVS